MPRSEYQGKPGANAGDDYHELWAVRRALELIVPGSTLVALTVENVRPEDADGVDASVWDGVDVACYRGTDPETITAVELVQLKYSGSDPAKSWTVSRLTHSDNKKRNNALIARLASAWRAQREQRPKLDASGSIKVKLVSNQSVSEDVSKALMASATDPDRVTLREASGLEDEDFNAFLRALDLSECGDSSRFAHEDRVIVTLSGLKDGDVRADYEQLRGYIRKRTLPEARRELITAESIFGLFGHADRRAFFPHPARIVRVEHLISRRAAADIRDKFLAGTTKLCLIGAGGEGKTTALQDLADQLPDGSELIVYDCYGEGSYLNANGYRHRAEDAFLQIGNEVAAHLLLPPLFAERGVDHPRRFAAKLAAAAEALAARDPGALLVVAVDAADNAVTAASQCTPPEAAFAHAFAGLGELPANARLLLRAREGRLPERRLPDDIGKVVLGPFRADESREFATARLGPQSDAWHEEFHRYSGGNPRVQRYAIDFAQGVAEQALEYLKPNGKNLGGIFEGRMREAQLKSGTSTDLSRLSAALVNLPRPVPIEHLAAVASVTPAHARDLVLDLAPGLVLDRENVGFADEDFEHFVRGAGLAVAPQVIQAAAEHLFRKRAGDAYAATHVSGMALLAGQRDTVIALVREAVRDYPIPDPGVRGEIHRKRLRAAMHVCRDTGDTIDAAALLLDGAHAIKTDEAVHRALCNHLELACHFSRDAITALVLRDRDRRPSHGALLLHLAGVDGIQGDRAGLNANVRSFFAWQTAREAAIAEEQAARGSAKEEEDAEEYYDAAEYFDEPQCWLLKADDVAAMLVGRAHADGAKAVVEILDRPRPGHFRFEIFCRLIRRLLLRGDLNILSELASLLQERPLARGAIALALGIAGKPVDAKAMFALLERAAAREGFSARRLTGDFANDDLQAEQTRLFLDACDILAVHGGDAGRLLRLLEFAMPEKARALDALTAYAPRPADVAARVFALAKVIAGETVKFEDFVIMPEAESDVQQRGKRKTPAQSEKAKRQPRDIDNDLRKAREIFEPILVLHEARARVLTGAISAQQAGSYIASALTSFEEARRNQYSRADVRARDDEAVRSLLPLGVVPGVDQAEIFAAISKSLSPVDTLFRFGTIALLERASVVPGFRTGIIDLAIASCEDLRARKISAEDKIDYVIGLAKLLLPLDQTASNYCFDAAISIAGDVDYDTVHALRVVSPLAERARLNGSPEAMDALALKLAAVAQDAGYRLGDSDGFPWRSVGEALAMLSPAVALAAASRFAELDFVRGTNLLSEVLERIARDQALDDEILAAFLPVLGIRAQALSDVLVARGQPSQAALLEEIARLQLLERPHEGHLAASHLDGLVKSGEWSHALVATTRFLETLPAGQNEDDQHGSSDWQPPKPKPIDEALFEPQGIDGVSSFLARIDAIVAAEARTYPSRRAAADRILERVPVYRIGQFLDILVALPEGDDIIHDFTTLLLQQFDRWAGRGAALHWARERLLNVIVNRLPEFCWNLDNRVEDLARLLDVAGTSTTDLTARLLEAIERHIDALSSRGVYGLVGLLGRYLSPTEGHGVLDRHVQAMLSRLESADRETTGFDTIGNVKETAARLLYSELGHIDHHHRWRAAHGLRMLARLGRTDILVLARARYEETTEPALSHPKAPFYFMAARLWFMLAVARIAWEAPAAVISMRDWIFDQAERSDFPHLLIRVSARTALEGLALAYPSDFDAASRARIAAITASPLPTAASAQRRWGRGFDRHRPLPEKGRRFRFDSLDTLPYWYTPLMRCFANPDQTVFLDRAEGWIVDRLGVTGDIWEYDKLRGNARFNRNGAASHHGHGSLPSLERYRTYLEWHAMFLAGGELLAEWPLETLEGDDKWDQLSSWLSRQGPTLAPLWLADLRQPKGLSPELWREPDQQTWLKPPGADVIREALGLDAGDWIVISRNTSIREGKAGGTLRVESALVSRKTATSLRLALEASENSHQYRLPVSDDDSHEIATKDCCTLGNLGDGSAFGRKVIAFNRA